MNQFETDQPYSIFKPKNSSKWWVRFSIKGQGQQRIPLGTRDENEAKQLALATWHETRGLANAGLSVTRKRFAAIAEEFIEQLEFDVRRGEKEEYQLRQYVPIIRRYFVGCFGKKMMTAIKADDIDAYWHWRSEYWDKGPGRHETYIRYERTVMKDGQPSTISIRRPVKEGPPSKSTLNKEAMLLRQIFEFGLKHKYTLELPLIKLPKSNKRTVNEKPGFTLKEFLRLEALSSSRVREAEAENPGSPLHHARTKLHCFCMIAGFSGMRVTELLRLTWGDFDDRKVELENGQTYEHTIIYARGKGKEREMVSMPEVLSYFGLLKNIFMLEQKREPTNTDPVFCNPNGKPIRSFKIGLAELLKAANLRETSDGRKRDSHSFRPFYVSQQIREGVNPHMLIRNTGTSGKMVNQHYNKILPSEEIVKLTPDWMGEGRGLRIGKKADV